MSDLRIECMSLAAPSYAELIAYEPFDYPVVGEDLFQENGGTGFSGRWRQIPNQWSWENFRTYEFAEGSLSFGGKLTSGNRVRSFPRRFTFRCAEIPALAHGFN